MMSLGKMFPVKQLFFRTKSPPEQFVTPYSCDWWCMGTVFIRPRFKLLSSVSLVLIAKELLSESDGRIFAENH